MEDVSTHESLMTDFVNSLINTKKSQVLSGARFDQITEYHMWSYSENIWPNAQRDWPNARAFGQTRARFTKRCAIGQIPRI